jgi:hypothetical protein
VPLPVYSRYTRRLRRLNLALPTMTHQARLRSSLQNNGWARRHPPHRERGGGVVLAPPDNMLFTLAAMFNLGGS